jgi:hypothetical protein
LELRAEIFSNETEIDHWQSEQNWTKGFVQYCLIFGILFTTVKYPLLKLKFCTLTNQKLLEMALGVTLRRALGFI